MLPVGTKLRVVGSYSSAVTKAPEPQPPAIKTLPLLSRVAVCPARAVVIAPVAKNVSLDCAITFEVGPDTTASARISSVPMRRMGDLLSSRTHGRRAGKLAHPAGKI